MRGEAKTKKMLKIKIKLAQFRLFMQKLHEQAKKIALAVVLTQYLLAGSYAIAQNKGWLEWLEPKIVYSTIYQARAEQIPEPKQEQPAERTVEEIALEIYKLESSNGKNNYSKCEAIGKINGIGYGIWGNNWQCFNSHAEEIETLHKWITTKQAQGMTEKELMCLYSGNNYSICKN